MKNNRRLSDIWNAIEDNRPENIKIFEWKRSFDGVSCALSHIGLQIVTTREEFNNIVIPITKNDTKVYMNRKIIVSRNGILSKKCSIKDFLSKEHGSLDTNDEKVNKKKEKSINAINRLQKGICCSHHIECDSSDKLSNILMIETYFNRVKLLESRRGDIAYCLLGNDIKSNVFVPDQEKSAQVTDRGQLPFNHHNNIIRISDMTVILKHHMSLTFIAKNKSNIPDVIWMFYGSDAINMLSKFPQRLCFSPRLHLKISSNNAFTKATNNKVYRFDIGNDKNEIKRLIERKKTIIQNGKKFSIEFLNYHDSQIMNPNCKIENKSFLMIREACQKNNGIIDHYTEDMYGPVDFRLNGIVRIQDKVVGNKRFHLRSKGGYPYNPDSIDILQVSNIINKTIYAIPMRYMSSHNIFSTFSEKELIKTDFWISKEFKEKYCKYYYILSNDEDVTRYIKNCNEAYNIPMLTDSNLYKNMLDKYKHLFGPKNSL